MPLDRDEPVGTSVDSLVSILAHAPVVTASVPSLTLGVALTVIYAYRA